jgi:hypothetical protein
MKLHSSFSALQRLEIERAACDAAMCCATIYLPPIGAACDGRTQLLILRGRFGLPKPANHHLRCSVGKLCGA